MAGRRSAVMLKRGGGVCALAISLLYAAAAEAQDVASCVAANNGGNELRQLGSLIAAKQEFLKCAAPHCPKLIQEECRELATRVESSIPTIILAPIDPSGRDIGRLSVFIGEKQLSEPQFGRPLPIDPGGYRIRFVAPDGRSVAGTIIVQEGAKNQSVRLELPAVERQKTEGRAPEPVAAVPVEKGSRAASSEPRAAAWVLAAAGAAALGSFAYFAINGWAQEKKLSDSCAPNCDDSDVDKLYRNYLIADISLGVGIVALGAATYFFLTPASKAESVAIGVSPARSAISIETRYSF